MQEAAQEIWASVTERGQVTIPAEVREKLGISNRSKVIFRIEDGAVVLKKPAFRSLEEIWAAAPRLNRPKTWEEIKRIAEEDRADAYLK
jgi:AbrB family looped-hinge helix DNA binding protein